jgi:hypothetical protein
MPKATDTDEGLKRLGGGRWQTRDERFTIEPQSGTWVVVDAEQTDELGLALVRGPFGSLGAAKAAIAAARDTEPVASPLSARAEAIRARPEPAAPASKRTAGTETPARSATPAKPATLTAPAPPSKAKGPAKPDAPTEPRWILALEPAERRRANRLIDRLTQAGAPDPEGIARRDMVGEVPATAAFAIARALANLGDTARPEQVADLLAGGRDEDLGVRWRLVDDDGRPITIDLDAARRR